MSHSRLFAASGHALSIPRSTRTLRDGVMAVLATIVLAGVFAGALFLVSGDANLKHLVEVPLGRFGRVLVSLITTQRGDSVFQQFLPEICLGFLAILGAAANRPVVATTGIVLAILINFLRPIL